VNGHESASYILKDFKEALLDLEYTIRWAHEQLDKKTSSIHGSIEGKDCKPTVAFLQNDPSVTCEKCLQQLHQRAGTTNFHFSF
jgi:hypothetical protein